MVRPCCVNLCGSSSTMHAVCGSSSQVHVLLYVGDLGTVDGCDTCYAALVDVIKDPSLDYLDTNLSFQEFGLAAADLLEACQNNLVAGLQSDLGFSALQLRGLESCGVDFGNFPKTVGVVQEYYQSKGVDISTLVPVLN